MVKTGIIHNVSKINWDTRKIRGIGGSFAVPNSSGFYHGLLKTWWEHYCNNKQNWLLVSENNEVKKVFEDTYKNKTFYTTELYDNFNKTTDFQLDICNPDHCANLPKVDVVVCQATLEHVYAPFQAVKNMFNSMLDDGYLIIHTHPPGFPYHQHPRDYLRFYSDWFEDIPNLIPKVKLFELVSEQNHIFSLYNKREEYG